MQFVPGTHQRSVFPRFAPSAMDDSCSMISSPVNYGDTIRIADGGQTVRNDDGGAAFAQAGQKRLGF